MKPGKRNMRFIPFASRILMHFWYIFIIITQLHFFRDANKFGFSVRCMCVHDLVWKWKNKSLRPSRFHIVQLFTQFHYQMLHGFYFSSFFSSLPSRFFICALVCGSLFVLLMEVGIFTRPKECCTTVNNMNCNLCV